MKINTNQLHCAVAIYSFIPSSCGYVYCKMVGTLETRLAVYEPLLCCSQSANVYSSTKTIPDCSDVIV